VGHFKPASTGLGGVLVLLMKNGKFGELGCGHAPAQ
jgi:hypothetical protein